MTVRGSLPVALSVTLLASFALLGEAAAAHASRGAHHTAAKRAPSAPPLGVGAVGPQEDDSAGVPSGAGDPLVENGLSSPLCKGAMSGGLSSAARGNCQTSSFVGAPAPTGNYAIDVNIDVGPFGLSKGGLMTVIQDVFITPLWNALVWVVHALLVMLEWCYMLELLDGSTMSSVSRSLREAQRSFTEPWLTLVLAAASVLALYNGLVRRRVGETLGQALLTLAMMAAGLWMIADPLGTVGAVGQWANQASLGTLGAVAHGTPANAPRTLADSMRALFAGTIEMPWCYLEFGNVSWCSDPALLDPGLRNAALKLAGAQHEKSGCPPSLTPPSCASSAGSASRLMADHSDELLREADTNGELFLAFPANGPQRNSVKESSSLLHVLCQAEDDTKCSGATAAQAEFRSDSGTFPRAIGVALIAAGVLGMVLLFGSIAIQLLVAALASLMMLLLAPLVVLAPALGDGGRAVFGAWLTRLLGAVSSKLLFSFVLGALLTLQRILTSLQPLGWWTDWLLISAFWWTAFLKRHRAFAALQARGSASLARDRHTIGQRLEAVGRAQRAVRHPVRWAKSKVFPPLPIDEQPRKRAPTGSKRDGKQAEERGTEVSRRARIPEPAIVRRGHGRSRPTAAALGMRAQLQRLRGAREAALAQGDRRRATKLAFRERRVEAELTRERERTIRAGPDERPDALRAPGLPDSSGSPHARGSRAAGPERGLAASGSSGHRGDDRFPSAAHHAGRSDARSDVRARVDAGRSLKADDRHDRGFRATEHARRAEEGQDTRPRPDPLEVKRAADRDDRQVSSHGSSVAPSRDSVRTAGETPPGVGGAPRDPRERKSPVMDDAQAVAQGRKRQLGFGPQR
jgi:hypothetical protein